MTRIFELLCTPGLIALITFMTQPVLLDAQTDAVTNNGDRTERRALEMPLSLGAIETVAHQWSQYIDCMALVPAGTFSMGNVSDCSKGRSREKPVHQVTMTQNLLMSCTEVTQAQYKAVTGEYPSVRLGPDLPVERVSWYDAIAFCNKLSLLEGLAPCYQGSDSDVVCDFSAGGYRLPTEAEWEYACRAGTETDYFTGNMTYPDRSPLDPALDRAGWYQGNAGTPANHDTSPVGRKEVNAFGLYDMHGNVYEWCWDRAPEKYSDSTNYYASSPVEDPRGPEHGNWRNIRGGSIAKFAHSARSSARLFQPPQVRYGDYGFRIVRMYSGPSAVQTAVPIPCDINLHQNYPNPFNPTTTITYTVQLPQRVSLIVTDLYGREVQRLLDGSLIEAGSHQANFDAAGLPSGVYFYRLIVGKQRQTKKMVVLR